LSSTIADKVAGVTALFVTVPASTSACVANAITPTADVNDVGNVLVLLAVITPSVNDSVSITSTSLVVTSISVPLWGYMNLLFVYLI
jgi:hypothetical protein